MGLWGWPFSNLPDLIADCRESGDYVISSAWTVLLGCSQLRLTSLSSLIVLYPPLLREGCGGRPNRVSGASSVVIDLRWPCDCTAQSSILSKGSVTLVLPCGIFLNDLGK